MVRDLYQSFGINVCEVMVRVYWYPMESLMIMVPEAYIKNQRPALLQYPLKLLISTTITADFLCEAWDGLMPYLYRWQNGAAPRSETATSGLVQVLPVMVAFLSVVGSCWRGAVG
jgi:hypothetical protein